MQFKKQNSTGIKTTLFYIKCNMECNQNAFESTQFFQLPGL